MGIGVDADLRAKRRLAVQSDDPAGPPEVASREREYLPAAGQAPREPDGDVVRIGAADPEQRAIELAGDDREQVLLETRSVAR